MILPTTNMRLTYEEIGIYVDNQSFAVVFYEFWAGRLIFQQKTTILSRAYEGIGMFVDDWKKMLS